MKQKSCCTCLTKRNLIGIFRTNARDGWENENRNKRWKYQNINAMRLAFFKNVLPHDQIPSLIKRIIWIVCLYFARPALLFPALSLSLSRSHSVESGAQLQASVCFCRVEWPPSQFPFCLCYHAVHDRFRVCVKKIELFHFMTWRVAQDHRKKKPIKN